MSFIQIKKSGIIFSYTKKDLENMRAIFNKYHYIKLPGLLNPRLLKSIQYQLDQDEFYEDRYKVGKDKATGFLPKNKNITSLLHFLVNDQKLFQLIKDITTCSHIGCFTGRVYSKIPGLGQYDLWHDDLSDNRMISMSINLSKDIYSGGVLQIFNCKSKKIIHEVGNTGFGDAIIFRISPNLKHRVTKVIGNVTRTTFTGWFRSKPDYKPIFKALVKYRQSAVKANSQKTNLAFLGNSTLTINRGLYYRNHEKRMLIFSPENTVCYGLDPIGAKILNLLQQPMTMTKILDTIHKEYEVESSKCEQDILSLLIELSSSGLITVDKNVTTSRDLMLGLTGEKT